MWQTDAIEIIKTLDAAEVKTGRDCEQMQQRVDSLRKEMQERSTQIADLTRTATCKTFSFILIVSNEFFSTNIVTFLQKRKKSFQLSSNCPKSRKSLKLNSTSHRLSTIWHRRFDFLILNQLESDPFQFSVSQVLRTIEEIQMWQTEQIEILKIIASSQPKDRREVDESIEKIEKVQEEEQQKSSQIREVLQQAHRKLHSPSNKFYNVFSLTCI